MILSILNNNDCCINFGPILFFKCLKCFYCLYFSIFKRLYFYIYISNFQNEKKLNHLLFEGYLILVFIFLFQVVFKMYVFNSLKFFYW